MKIVRFFLTALAISAATSAFAYEVDNFTDRDTLVRDAMPVLDAEVNHILRRAVLLANKDSDFRCNKVALRSEIVRWVGPDPISILELWATTTSSIERTHVGASESIYSDASLAESPAITLAGIGRSFKMGGYIVGTDKIGHFFMQGLDYYKRVTEAGEDLDHVLQYDHGEDGFWGLSTSGVKSYADMAANYQGYRFWSQLYSGENPYIRCEGTHWVKSRDFSFADYVSPAWDEAVNCSEMKPSLQAKVDHHLSAMGLHCPVDLRQCEAITHLEKSAYWVSPKCMAAAASPQPSSARYVSHLSR